MPDSLQKPSSLEEAERLTTIVEQWSSMAPQLDKSTQLQGQERIRKTQLRLKEIAQQPEVITYRNEQRKAAFTLGMSPDMKNTIAADVRAYGGDISDEQLKTMEKRVTERIKSTPGTDNPDPIRDIRLGNQDYSMGEIMQLREQDDPGLMEFLRIPENFDVRERIQKAIMSKDFSQPKASDPAPVQSPQADGNQANSALPPVGTVVTQGGVRYRINEDGSGARVD